MTQPEIFAEVDKLLADRVRTQEMLVRIDGALQAFHYILQHDFPGVTHPAFTNVEPAPPAEVQ